MTSDVIDGGKKKSEGLYLTVLDYPRQAENDLPARRNLTQRVLSASSSHGPQKGTESACKGRD